MQVERTGGQPAVPEPPVTVVERAPAPPPTERRADEPPAESDSEPRTQAPRPPLPALVENMNLAARILHTNLRFQVHEDSSHQIIIQVVDSVTGQILRTVPPDKVAEAHLAMQNLVGLLLDAKI